MDGETVWKWLLRGGGLVGFAVLLGLYAAGREVDVAWIVLIGGMMGLERVMSSQKRLNGS